MPFEMKPIPKETPDDKRWEVEISRDENGKINLIRLSSRFGVLIYGFRPEGYPSWTFAPVGGGGATSLPYAITPDGDLLVAMILENRPNMGEEPVWCLIGGFLKPGETHLEALRREQEEEGGFSRLLQTKELAGLPFVSDRLFWVADIVKKEGTHAAKIQVPFNELELDGEGYKIKDSLLFPEISKKVPQVRFFPWRKAVDMTADSLALAAMAKLFKEVL